MIERTGTYNRETNLFKMIICKAINTVSARAVLASLAIANGSGPKKTPSLEGSLKSKTKMKKTLITSCHQGRIIIIQHKITITPGINSILGKMMIENVNLRGGTHSLRGGSRQVRSVGNPLLKYLVRDSLLMLYSSDMVLGMKLTLKLVLTYQPDKI